MVQGVTEWLPISSTGHMILLNRILPTDIYRDEAFFDLFSVVIQLFSVLAVVVVFFYQFFPCFKERNRSGLKTTVNIWKKAIVAMIPLGVLGILLENKISEYLFSPITVAICLIVYGVAFILIEKHAVKSNASVLHIENISTAKALGIGIFQAFSLVPGTSRSGSTILGARLLGISRGASAEFSFAITGA